MKDWNVVVTVYQDGFRRAVHGLQKLGDVERSPYHNVLVMKTQGPIELLNAIEKATEDNPALYDVISRVAPAVLAFNFLSESECIEKSKSIIHEWLPRLTGKTFHVRLHRRGMAHELQTQAAERLFNDAIVEATTEVGSPAKISFTDPDVVIAIDTIDMRAGLGLWTREEMARNHLLRPD